MLDYSTDDPNAPLSVLQTAFVLFSKPTILLLMLTFLGANFVATIFLTWTPTFLVEKFHFKLAAAGLSGSAFIHLASAVSVPIGGLLADRLARRLVGGRMLVQAAGLLVGSAFVFIIGTTANTTTLLSAMTCFGLCKGLYDSNIFASVYDAIEPRARSSAAGIMNTVGWGGGAVGPLVVGWIAKHGSYASEMDNMSHAIAWTGIIYIVGAALLLLAGFVFAPRDATASAKEVGIMLSLNQYSFETVLWCGAAIGCLIGFAQISRGQSATVPTTQSSDAIISTEFINPNAPYPSCHASTIAEVAPGELVAAWFGGTKERAPDVGIWIARYENGKWLDAVEVANGVQLEGPRLPTWNPVLFAPDPKSLVLFYKVGPSPSTWWGMMMTSSDGGRTWSKPTRLPDHILGPIKDKPVQLKDGSWLCPSSTEGDGGWRVHFELSRDAGKTWELVGPVDKGKDDLSAIQPSVMFHGDGRLQAICRTNKGILADTWSSDQGKTWSPLAATTLPNPNSGVDGVTLADGRQLLVYNNSAPPPERPTKGLRYPIDVAISSDGVQWKHVLVLDSEPNGAGYAYPAVIQARDGRVHITYTWDRKMIKHVVLDPTKL